jgi:hypothetical protein
MREIIKEGTPWKYKLSCDECLCEFYFTNEDFGYNYSNKKEMVYCPCCHKLLLFDKKDCLYSATLIT